MIFATVGTQLPFDRLLQALETWAARNPNVPVLAQSGDCTRKFAHVQTIRHLTQTEFSAALSSARLIVAHAGMGTILSASELGKPVILMPRRAKFDEHRNDHQLDTANEMRRLSNVTVVDDGEALHQALDLAVSLGFESGQASLSSIGQELDPLIEEVRKFVWTGAAYSPAGSMLDTTSAA